MTPLIEFKNTTLGYGRKVILRDISFVIHEGDYFGMVGPNGAGKTTLLRAILQTLKPISGTVRIGSPESPAVRFGYVPQRDTIDYSMPYNVHEVVMMGRYREIGLFRCARKPDHEIVMESLRHVGIEDLAGLVFQDLSGGQKQRVLIARALASKPGVLILDEPTNGMDLSSRSAILGLIRSLHEEARLTVIMVSHLLNDVANHVGRIAIVEPTFFQVGDVDEVLTEANLSAAYQQPIRVRSANGSKIISTGGPSGNV